MSASRQANAQRSGTSPSRSVVVQRGVGDAARRARARPALHSAAARMTSRFDGVARRTERRGQLDGALGVRRPPSRRRRRPSPAPPTPTPAAPAAAAAPIRRRARRARSSAARRRREPAHAERVGGQPDQRVGAGLGGRRRPAPSPGRPTCGPGRASRADAETTRGCCAPATPTGRRAAARQQRRQVGQRAAVAALTAGGDGAQPQFVRRRARRAAASVAGRPRRRRWPARQCCMRIATLSMRRAKTRYRRARIRHARRINIG